MGCILNEKDYEYESESVRWLFQLVLYSDPADEPSVTVRRQVKTEDGHWPLDEEAGVYVRRFDRDGFHERHYENFRKKFVRDEEYREQFFQPDLHVDRV